LMTWMRTRRPPAAESQEGCALRLSVGAVAPASAWGRREVYRYRKDDREAIRINDARCRIAVASGP
jgi:hypothetical protein